MTTKFVHGKTGILMVIAWLIVVASILVTIETQGEVHPFNRSNFI